ncbi:hypothetical protein [Oceanobacillus oncorhynchi]
MDYKAGGLFLIGSIPGSMCGAWLNQYVQANIFYHGESSVKLSPQNKA